MQAPVSPNRIPAGTVLLPGLARARAERDLSQKKLAEKAGVDKDTVWRLETLQRGARYRTRTKLARALRTTLADLRTPDEEVNES